MQKKSHNSKKSFASYLGTFAALLFFCYFAFHAINGENGFFAMAKLSKAVEEARNELDIINAEKIYYQQKTTMLRDDSLDLDLLDEQARQLLGYAGEEETVYNIN